MPKLSQSELKRKVDAHREVVRRAAGFLTADDLKTPGKNKEYKRHELDAIGRKFDAHKSHAPYQIILRKSAKAIEREDGVSKVWHQDMSDLQEPLTIRESVRRARMPLGSPPPPYTEEMNAMRPWYLADYEWIKSKRDRRRLRSLIKWTPEMLEEDRIVWGDPSLEERQEITEAYYNSRQSIKTVLNKHDGSPGEVWDRFDAARWVLDIAYYTNDLEQATHVLYVGDEQAEVERISGDERKPARPGWNKRNSNIAIVLSAENLLKRTTLRWTKSDHSNHPRNAGPAYNVARFTPKLTAFLAAMAPHAPNRHLVIKYCIEQVILVQLNRKPYTAREVNQAKKQWLKDDLVEWYAFHLLRRMFRMRFGCSLFPQPEPTGALSEIRKSQDMAWLYYKNQVGKAYKGL